MSFWIYVKFGNIHGDAVQITPHFSSLPSQVSACDITKWKMSRDICQKYNLQKADVWQDWHKTGGIDRHVKTTRNYSSMSVHALINLTGYSVTARQFPFIFFHIKVYHTNVNLPIYLNSRTVWQNIYLNNSKVNW